MKAAIHPHGFNQIAIDYNHRISLTKGWDRFIAFATAQEKNRFTWTAVSVLGHGTVLTIGTFAAVVLTGNLLFLLAPTCLTMAMVLVVNLVGLPTKYTIPVFFLSVLIDLIIVATALALWI